jgi:hypothetical protein
VTDGHAGDLRHVHQAEVEVLTDRHRGVVGELEQGPERHSLALVQSDLHAVGVG